MKNSLQHKTTNNKNDCEGVDSTKSYILIVKEDTCDESQDGEMKQVTPDEEMKVECGHKELIKSSDTDKSKWKERYDRYQKKMYICGLTLCDKTFSRFCDLIRHDRLDHQDLPADKLCSVCNKMFIDKDRLNLHLLIYHSEKKYACDVCSGKFLSKASLRAHMKKHTGQWVCSECGLSVGSNTALLEHKRKHSTDKPFVCDIVSCGRTYKTKTNLNSHKQMHSKELPFKCDLCEYTASNHCSMRNHKKTHSSEKEYICETCGKMFKLKYGLEDHRKTHDPNRQHACDVCKITFITKYKLMLHKRVHSGERPFVCDVCSKQFARRDALKEHSRIHTGEKRYSCKKCTKQFSFSKSLKNHKCASDVNILKGKVNDTSIENNNDSRTVEDSSPSK